MRNDITFLKAYDFDYKNALRDDEVLSVSYGGKFDKKQQKQKEYAAYYIIINLPF